MGDRAPTLARSGPCSSRSVAPTRRRTGSTRLPPPSPIPGAHPMCAESPGRGRHRQIAKVCRAPPSRILAMGSTTYRVVVRSCAPGSSRCARRGIRRFELVDSRPESLRRTTGCFCPAGCWPCMRIRTRDRERAAVHRMGRDRPNHIRCGTRASAPRRIRRRGAELPPRDANRYDRPRRHRRR